jgi:hypothetical protein
MTTIPNEPADGDLALREELVAYLDGELDAEGRRHIEDRLAAEPELRRMLQELDRTWNLLDELGAPPVDEDFTRTTLEMAALAADEDAVRQRAEAPRRRRRRWLAAAGGLLAAAAAGFAAVALLAPDPNAQLLRDLPVLESLDQYRHVDSIDFLRMLARAKLFTEEADEPAVEWPATIQDMSAAQKEDLYRRRQQFAAMTPDEQERIRRLHEQLQTDAEGEKLRETMVRYGQWLAALPAYSGAQLLELDPAERVKQIRQMLQEQNRLFGRRLDAKDLKAIISWLDQYATEHEAGLVEGLPKAQQAQLAKLAPAARHRAVLRTVCQHWQSGNRTAHPAITDADAAELRAQLSQLSPELSSRLESKPAAQQSRVLEAWIRQAARQQLVAQRGEGLSLLPGLDNQLADYFEFQLSPEERDRLMSLPADEMQQRLRELYLTQTKSGEPGKGRADRPAKGKRPAGPGPKSKKEARPAAKSPPEPSPAEKPPDGG